MEMEKFDIPNLLFFQSGNIYSGSRGKFNFKLIPKDGLLKAHSWQGLYCLEKTPEPVEKQEFPLDAEGRQAMIEWIEKQYTAFWERSHENEEENA